MSPIELTDDQSRQIDAEHGQPVDVIDPASKRTYVLLASELFDKVRAVLSPQPPLEQESAADLVPPGILRSQQAFWRDLPELLKTRKNHGKWVCYHGEERIGIGAYEELIRECLRRGIPDDEYDLACIRPRELPPWAIEEVEAIGPHHRDDYQVET